MNSLTTPTSPPPAGLSLWSAWWAVVGVSLRRQARLRQTLWIALGLLALAVAVVLAMRFDPMRKAAYLRASRLAADGVSSASESALGMAYRRFPNRNGVALVDYDVYWASAAAAAPLDPATAAVQRLASGTLTGLVRGSPIMVFARWVAFSLFVSFLLPLWTLSFATEGLGGERESRTMTWLLTRPLPRWAIYLAKFVAVLPWCLAIAVGGFALICLAAGEPGWIVFRMFWPAVAMGATAFAALFHFFAAWARRPMVVGLLYAFFLEVLLGDMPGLMKRISISFYVRCLMFDAAAETGLTPDKPHVYMPVDGATAWIVLIAATATLLLVGMVVFSRREYGDDV